MSRRRQRLWASLRKICVFTVAVMCAMQIFSADRAQAQAIVDRTCAQLDPSQGGAPITSGAEVNLTVAEGDRITITNNLPPLVTYTPPGGVPITVASPAVITVGAGQAGVWVIGSPATTTCTVAPTPTPTPRATPTPEEKSETTDGMMSTFMRVGGSILDTVIIPGTALTIDRPVSDEPLKLAPQVALSDPFYDKYGAIGLGHQPQGLAALGGDPRSESVNFTLDLRSAMNKADETHASAYDGMNEGDARYRGPWNAWVSGRYVDFDDANANADRDGHLWWVMSGLSYQVGERTTIGAFSRVRKGEVASVALDTRLDSDFYGGGAFFATRLARGLGLAAAMLYEHADSDISIEGATGSFDNDQWTVEGRIDKRFMWGPHWIEPAIALLYTHVERDGYADSTGAFVPGSELELGRLTYGPKIGTTIQKGRSEIKPFVRIEGIWDFVNDGDYLLANSVVISNADTAVMIGGGAEVAFLNGTIATVAGDWFGFTDDLDGWSVTGAVGMPLAVLGLDTLAPTSLVRLGLAASPEAQSATAKVTIPLN